MQKNFILLAILVSTALTMPLSSEAQVREITLWGHVFDKLTHHAVRDSKAVLMTSDSTIIDSITCSYSTGGYYGTDANYHFLIPRKAERYIILVSHPDYEDCYVDFEVRKPGRNTYFDAPWHYLTRKLQQPEADMETLGMGYNLEGVTVKATRVKMVYKNDTIVFDARAFSLPDGSMLDALVRQMPGVELKADGTILVNGEKIDCLTLNGKDFFKGRNKVVLENLPLYTVENVKVYRKSSEKSEWLGHEVEQKDYVMDVHLKREYNEGYMVNAIASGGTEDRYADRLFLMRFTDASQMSGLVSSNNLNESNIPPGEDGDWNPSRNLGNGLNKLTSGAYELSIYDKHKRWDEMLAVMSDHSKKSWETREMEELLSSDGNHVNNSNEKGGNSIYDAAIANRFRWKDMFSPLKVNMVQMVEWKKADSHNYTDKTIMFSADTLNQTTIRESGHQAYEWRFDSKNTVNYKTGWGDDLEVGLSISHRKDSGTDERSFALYDYPMTGQRESVERFSSSPSHYTNVKGNIVYSIHALNRWNYVIAADLSHIHRRNENNHYLGDVPDLENTTAYSAVSRQGGGTLRAYYNNQERDKYTWINVQLNVTYTKNTIRFHSVPLDANARDRYYLPFLYADYVRNTSRQGFELHLQSQTSRADIGEKIPFQYTFDPLYRSFNNPRLRTSHTHALTWKYRTSLPEHQQTLTVNGNFFFSFRQQGTRTAYDQQSGMISTMKDNVDKLSWTVNMEGHFSSPIDKAKRLILDAHTRLNYQRNVDYDIVKYDPSAATSVSEILSSAPLRKVCHWLNTEHLRLSYRNGGFETGLDGDFSYRHTTGGGNSFSTLNVFEYNYGLRLQCQLPWKVHLAADAKIYSRRGFESSFMNKDDFISNASLSRSFFKESVTVKLEAFDIFHQLKSVDYQINSQGRTETWRKTIPSYVMLHLQWRWNHLPKKR